MRNERASYPCKGFSVGSKEGKGVCNMGFMKKSLAIVLVVVMTFGVAMTAFAAGSPNVGPDSKDVNPGYDDAKHIDNNTQDHTGNRVSSIINDNNTATLYKVTSLDGESGYKTVTVNTARNKDNQKVTTTKIGDGKNGVFNSKSGRKVTTVKIKSDAKVTVSAKAFKGSKVKKIEVSSQKVSFKKNAFDGTKTKNPTITFSGAKKASDITVSKGAFKGLNENAKIVVKGMSKKEFNKLKTKLEKAGFTGKITRK